MIINKIQGWPQATQPITTNKNDNNQQGRSPTVQTTATSKNDKDCQGQQQLTAPHTPQVPPSPPPGKSPCCYHNRVVITIDNDMANIMNNYFSSVFTIKN